MTNNKKQKDEVAVEPVQEEIETSENQAEIIDLKNQLARALADYDNLRKRSEGERGELIRFASLGIVVKLLPILDQLEVAQTHLNDTGLGLTIKTLAEIVKGEGVEEIEVKAGDEFNPDTCEVTEVVDEGGKKATIAGVVVKGWRFKDGPVVRHVRVKVNK